MKFNFNLAFALLMLCSPCIATSSSGDELVSSLIEEAEQLETRLDELEEENWKFSLTRAQKNGQRFRLRHIASGKYLTEVGCDNGQHLILRDIGHTGLGGSQKFFFANARDYTDGWNVYDYDQVEIWSDRCNKPIYVRGGHNRRCEQEGLDRELKIWDYVPDATHNKFYISQLRRNKNQATIFMHGCWRNNNNPPIGITEVRNGDKFVGLASNRERSRHGVNSWMFEYDS